MQHFSSCTHDLWAHLQIIFWLNLAKFIWAKFGQFWPILANFGRFWPILANFGRFWPILPGWPGGHLAHLPSYVIWQLLWTFIHDIGHVLAKFELVVPPPPTSSSSSSCFQLLITRFAFANKRPRLKPDESVCVPPRTMVLLLLLLTTTTPPEGGR